VAPFSKSVFPDWSKAVPESPGIWTVNREEFANVIKGASLVAHGSDLNDIVLAFDSARKCIVAASESRSTDRFESDMSAVPSGKVLPFLRVRMNAYYLLDAIDACSGEMLRIGVEREISPVAFRGDGNMFVAVVKPMRQETE